MNNIETILNSNLYKRLCELRVDFAYSKNLFFAASYRVKNENVKNENRKRIIEITSIIFDIITISSIAVYFTQVFKDLAIILIGILSIFSLILSVIGLINKNSKNETEYYTVANEYIIIYKKCKNYEAKCKDGLVSIDELGRIVDELTLEQSKLFSNNLPTTNDDYENAKKSIDNGNASYTENDFKNT